MVSSHGSFRFLLHAAARATVGRAERDPLPGAVAEAEMGLGWLRPRGRRPSLHGADAASPRSLG
jgi:hypothetical protein